MKCWFAGITLSLVSSSASLVKLRADGRRFALSSTIARREGQEKTPEDRVREEEERREKGRALLACVSVLQPVRGVIPADRLVPQAEADPDVPAHRGRVRYLDPSE